MVWAFAWLLFGAVAMLVGGFVMYDAYDHPDAEYRLLWPVGGIITAILLAGTGIWMWRIRSVPLIVDSATGEVRYGSRLICEARTVTAVRLACSQMETD